MKFNKYLCFLMAVLMLLTVCFPMAVFADDDAELVDEELYTGTEAVEDELLPDEFLPDDNVPAQEDVQEEQNEDSQLENEEIPEEPQASEQPQEQNNSENVPGEQGEENAFEAAYIKIVEQPKDAAGAVGAKVTFHVTAKNVVAYKWQVSANNGEKWIDASSKYYDGVTTDTITVPVKAARDGYQFRCVLTSGTGKTVNTSVATLTVANGPVITEQPKDASGAAGTKVTFHVAASNAATYKWEVSTNNGEKWIAAGSSYYKGVTTDTITVPVKDARDGFLFRCVVSDSNGNSVTSNAAKLTVAASVTITEQPKDASGAAGTKVTFHVAAKNATAYKWEVSTNNGEKWIDANSKYYDGVTTDTITVPVKDARDGFLFRCVVSGSNDTSVNSDSAKLTVEKKITVNGVIYEKLTDTTCAVVGYTGTNTTYTVEKTVNGMTVTEIGEEAFMGNTNLKSITLPDSIAIIRARAFKDCTNLSKMG